MQLNQSCFMTGETRLIWEHNYYLATIWQETSKKKFEMKLRIAKKVTETRLEYRHVMYINILISQRTHNNYVEVIYSAWYVDVYITCRCSNPVSVTFPTYLYLKEAISILWIPVPWIWTVQQPPPPIMLCVNAPKCCLCDVIPKYNCFTLCTFLSVVTYMLWSSKVQTSRDEV